MKTPLPIPGGFPALKTAFAAAALSVAAFTPVCAGQISINVQDYGAVPGDASNDAPAFQSAVNALKTAGGGVLFIPAGTYRFYSRVSVTAGAWTITLQGEGNATELQCHNTAGVFQLTHTSRAPQVTFNELRFTAQLPSAGTAIEVTCPVGGAQDKRVVTINHVAVTAAGSNYFQNGMVVQGLYRPLIVDSSVSRAVNATDMSDTSINFQPAVGIDVTDCYASVIERCVVSGAYTAYHFDSSSAVEDGAVRNSSADYCRIGIYYAQAGAEPTLWISGCDIRARDIGAYIYNRKSCFITDNTFRKLASTVYTLTDVWLDGVRFGYVLRNTFLQTLSYGRKNVRVISSDNWIIIKENTLSGASASAIQIDAGAQNILSQ